VKLPTLPQERFAIYSADGQPAPQPNFIRVSAFPNVLEAETKQRTAKAPGRAKALPLALNGVISQAGTWIISRSRGERPRV
jgi:hypothetical protein